MISFTLASCSFYTSVSRTCILGFLSQDCASQVKFRHSNNAIVVICFIIHWLSGLLFSLSVFSCSWLHISILCSAFHVTPCFVILPIYKISFTHFSSSIVSVESNITGFTALRVLFCLLTF